jgi:hypothetical protein
MESTPRWQRFALIAMLSLSGFVPGLAEDAPQILFLTLKLEKDQVSLIRSATAPGTLKPSVTHPQGLEMELTSGAGQLLWRQSVTDPSIQRLEYEDPDHPGRIVMKVVQLTNVEFTVRVPALTNAQRLHFYQSSAFSSTNAAASSAPREKAIAESRRSLGHVTLPAATDKQ